MQWVGRPAAVSMAAVAAWTLGCGDDRQHAAPPDDARVTSQLAAADPLALLAAVEAAERALEPDGSPAAALFAHADALERLGLDPEARSAWWRYLAVDRSSARTDEARTRLSLLDRRRREAAPAAEADLLAALEGGDAGRLGELVDGDRQATRELGETLLGRWAEALAAGDGAAAGAHLGSARALGDLLAELGGDRMLADSVSAIDAAAAAPAGRARLARLAEGHRAHAAGLAAHAAYEAEAARARFGAAADALAAAGSPFAGWSAVYRAIQAYRRSDWPAAVASTGRVLDRCDPQAHPVLTGRAHWVRGLVFLAGGSPSAALDAYAAAAAAFERAGESGNAAFVRGLRAEAFWFLGERERAWELYLPLLRDLDLIRETGRRHALLDGMADALAELGHPRLELRLRDRQVGLHEDGGEAVDLAHALLKRGRTLGGLGLRARARADLAAAEPRLAAIGDPEVRELLRTDWLVSGARLEGGADAAGAVDSLGEAIRYYEERSRHFPLTQLYYARARLLRGLGRAAAAEDDLRAALRSLERQRGEIREALRRGVFFVRSEAVFEELISLLAEQPGREAEAFQVAEQARARVLLDLVLRSAEEAGPGDFEAAAPRPVPPLAEILAALPPDAEVVAYSVLEAETLAWILDRGGVEQVRLAIGRDELSVLAGRFLRAASGGSPADAVLAAGGRLSERVVLPVIGRPGGGGTLVVVPGGPLVGLPFAALAGREPGRFLVEERPVAIVPSAAALVELERRAAGRPAAPAAPLVLGAPVLEGGTEALPPLPAAGREIARVAALYPGAELVGGERATREALLRGLSDRTLVHFAGHAVANARDPLGSALVLARGGPRESGRLEARDVLRLRFEASPLVVLASCATDVATARVRGTELTLASSFLASGAVGVVGSLWPVEDAATEELMVALHRGLAAGLAPAEALAAAQREVMGPPGRGRRSPESWAAFVSLGGPVWRSDQLSSLAKGDG